MNRGGMNGHYKYSVMSSHERGVAVVGTYFEQAQHGYIHAPLLHDDPERVYSTDQTQFSNLLRLKSRECRAQNHVR